MHRVVAGGTGLIGKRLIEHWLRLNHTITVISRSVKHVESVFGNRVKAVSWAGLNTDVFQSAELVVNLTGENIGAARWNAGHKKEIINSRTGSTRAIAAHLCKLSQPVPRFFNASAVGIYGLQPQFPDKLPPALDEDTVVDCAHPKDFLSKVGCEWEKAAAAAVEGGVPVVFMRFGVVLSGEGGALPMLVKPFKWYLGGAVGSGAQPFSWVALDDVVRAIDFLVEKPEITGAVNIVSPGCVSQHEFARTLSRVLARPAFMKTPAFLLKLILGAEMARDLVLEGQHVSPKRLQSMGFSFLYPDLESALNHVLR
ncbi:Epimerase family protein [Aquicella siphonis]|uniref:Epimerase family protein n=1 Tax=Aquicella siphonis TaxID=254247 RepID=A0A5E4PJZ0_9COXI|nr:TIGR01777 family oxidoreductase [Aquicella siphonis]VVC76632.1 Epimerase family protein [Aquicella siphonis]